MRRYNRGRVSPSKRAARALLPLARANARRINSRSIRPRNSSSTIASSLRRGRVAASATQRSRSGRSSAWTSGPAARATPLRHHLRQLVDVARPRVGVQAIQRLRREAGKLLAAAGVELLEEDLGQQRQVLAPLGQRGQLDGDRAEHGGQVLAIPPPPRQLAQRLLGRGDQPQLRRPRGQHRRQVLLNLGGNLVGLEKEERVYRRRPPRTTDRADGADRSRGSIPFPTARSPAAPACRRPPARRRNGWRWPSAAARCPAVPPAARWPGCRRPRRLAPGAAHGRAVAHQPIDAVQRDRLASKAPQQLVPPLGVLLGLGRRRRRRRRRLAEVFPVEDRHHAQHLAGRGPQGNEAGAAVGGPAGFIHAADGWPRLPAR